MKRPFFYQYIIPSIIFCLTLFFLAQISSFFKHKHKLEINFLHHSDLTFEKKFTFVLFANEEKLFMQTLSSVLSQNYDNFKLLVFVKNTLPIPIFQTLCKRYNKEHDVEFFPIKKSQDFIATYKKAISTCLDEEIIVQISGDDWLCHPNVLKTLNQIYTSSDQIWLTYPESLEYPSYKKTTRKTYLKKWLFKPKHDKIPFMSSQLKTYYAGLAKQIKEPSQFGLKHKMLENNLDLFLLPMIHQAKNHIHYIEDVLYIHKSIK